MKVVQFISRLLVGLLFIFSGFVKAIDPMGSTFKFTDYFLAFGMDGITGISFVLAVLFSTLEFTLGVALLLNARIKTTAYLALILMLFFTPLTLLLAITNPVSDCGCFGDALVLTNWQTFGKNILILALSLLVFFRRKEIEKKETIVEQNLLLLFSLLVSIGLSTYSYLHLPLIDFRPYHIGANISDGMVIPEGAAADEYRSLFKYEKNGIVKEFDESNYPWQDTTWKFVDSEQTIIKKGYTPPIHDFSISNKLDGDITNSVLSNETYTFLLVSKNLNEINKASLEKIRELSIFALENNIQFIGLTASDSSAIQRIKLDENLPFDFYNTDEIQIKTMIRSNPGLLLLKKGTILDKWHYNDFPKAAELKGDLAAHSITKHQALNINLFIISITSISLLFLVLFSWIRIRFTRVKNRLRL